MPARMIVPVMAIVLLLTGWGRGRTAEPAVLDGKLQFSLSDLNGSEVDFPGDFRGKVVYVTIWGTWCPPCISEIPTLISLQSRHRDGGLVVIAIAFEREETSENRRAKLNRFVEKRGINYLVLDGGSAGDLNDVLPMIENVQGLPVEIFIDRSGNVVESRNSYGYQRRWAEDLERQVEDLLGTD